MIGFKKFFCMVLFATLLVNAGIAGATVIELKPPTTAEGFVSYTSNYVGNTTDIRIGNPPGGLVSCMGVIKFSLAEITEEVVSAELQVWVSRVFDAGGDGTYLKLQHFTNDVWNAGTLVRADASSTAAVTDVGGLISLVTADYTSGVGPKLTWDVTEVVEADRLLEYHSSFRIVLVNASGTPVVGVDNDIVCLCTQDNVAGYSTRYPDYYPRIAVVVPEPATVFIMMIGGAFCFCRKLSGN